MDPRENQFSEQNNAHEDHGDAHAANAQPAQLREQQPMAIRVALGGDGLIQRVIVNNDVQQIIIAHNLLEIGEIIFAGHSNLREVVFEGVPRQILPQAFHGCSRLETVRVPAGTMHVSWVQGGWAASLRVPAHVEEIRFHPAYEYFGLQEVIFEAGSRVRTIEDRAFLDCEQFSKVAVEGANSMVDNDISSLRQLGQIGVMAFFGCCSLGAMKLPDNISLGEFCFWGTKINDDMQWMIPHGVKLAAHRLGMSYRKIKAVTLPEGVARIKKLWFYGSTVEILIIPESVREIDDEAFANVATLRDVKFASRSVLERIGRSLFSGTSIESLTVPASVREIADEALMNVPILKKITFALDSRLERVGDLAFAKTGLESFDAPASLKVLGNNVFLQCHNLKRVGLPSVLECIGESCFKDSVLEDITIYQTVKSIGRNAFSGCKNLKPLTFRSSGDASETLCIPEGIEEIEKGQFQGEGVAKVRISSTVTRIGAGAFCDWKSLTEIEFANGSALERIGSNAFENCGLSEFVVPSTLLRIEKDAFKNNTKLQKMYVPDKCKIIDVDQSINVYPVKSVTDQNQFLQHISTTKDIILPEGLRAIGTWWFSCSSVQKVTIPDSVTEIQNNAFWKAADLAEVVFGNNSQLETIREDAFRASGLKSFTAPSLLRTIQQGAFAECKRFANVVLNEGLEVLGTAGPAEDGTDYCGVFYKSALQTVKLPSTLTKIECEVFRECVHLKEIALPDGLKEIGEWAFGKCGLEHIRVPPELTIIEAYAFRGCESLRTLRFSQHSSLKRIKKGAFLGTGLQSFQAPSSLREIGYLAFCNCMNLSKVQLNNQIQRLGYLCFYGVSLWQLKYPKRFRKTIASLGLACSYKVIYTFPDNVEIIGRDQIYRNDIDVAIIPASVRKIKDSAFKGMACLKHVYFDYGSRIEEIGAHAFENSGLVKFYAPKGLRVIRAGAFAGCTQLENVTLHKGLKLVEEGAFTDVPALGLALPNTNIHTH